MLASESKAKNGKREGPPISTGSWVGWSNGKGRVDMIVTSGKVPGVSEDVEGTKDSPAARVVVYEPKGKGHAATGKKIGAKTHTLRRIAPLVRPSQAKDAAEPGMPAVVAMHAEHGRQIESKDLPATARVGATAVKSVYERGLDAWPGREATPLTREEWATARVGAFLDLAAGDRADGYRRDDDLLGQSR